MMRRPTDTTDLYSWWQKALAGEPVAYHESHPECGFYRTRDRIAYREYGPWIPVSILLHSPIGEDGFLDGDEAFIAWRDGVQVDPLDVWVWCCRNPISEEDYELLCFERAMEKEFA